MIFYIDDDPSDLDIFVEVLDELVQPVRIFKSVAEFIVQMEEAPATGSLLFLDINMPVTSGLNALEMIRKSKKWKHIPVVMLSTSGNHSMIQESHFLGANMYVVKPAVYEKLRKIIGQVLKIDWAKRNVSWDNFLYQS